MCIIIYRALFNLKDGFVFVFADIRIFQRVCITGLEVQKTLNDISLDSCQSKFQQANSRYFGANFIHVTNFIGTCTYYFLDFLSLPKDITLASQYNCTVIVRGIHHGNV